MKKSFKLTHKPRQVLVQPASFTYPSPEVAVNDIIVGESFVAEALGTKVQGNGDVPDNRLLPTPREESPTLQKKGMTTRKTIEVPEEYFYQVKMRALQRRIKEKDMWAEILEEYFSRHPNKNVITK